MIGSSRLPTAVLFLGGREALVERSLLELLATGLVGALVVLALGGLFVYGRRNDARRITDRVLDDPTESFAWGIGVTIVAIILAIVLRSISSGLAAVVLVFFALLSLAAAVFGYLAIGRFLTGAWRDGLIVGAGIAVIATGVPIAGTAIGFVAGCLGLGALVLEHRSEYDREFERYLAGPGTVRSRIDLAAEDGVPIRFALELEYWNGSEWRKIVEYNHDHEESDRNVSEAALYANVRREKGGVDVEAVAGPLPAAEALERAIDHLDANLERLVRGFEAREGLDESTATHEYEEPLTDDELRTARATLAEQYEDVRGYLADVRSDGRVAAD